MSTGFTYAIALLLALTNATATAREVEVQVGIVQSVSPEHLILQKKDDTAHIGFVAAPAALRSLKSIKKGQEVRAVFGTATDSRTRAQIGTLISIRVCTANDAECDADRKRIEEKSEKQSQVASAQKTQQCLQAMQETLEKDPRFGPPLAAASSGDALAAYNNLSGEQRTCASKFAGDYHAAYMEACDEHHCGDGIAGGCAHLSGRTAHPDFHAKALQKCAP